MIDPSDLELFASSVRRAMAPDPVQSDHGLAGVGWQEALREWGGEAIRVVFTEQGSAAMTSTALDDVLGWVLGLPTGSAVLLPAVSEREVVLGTPDALTVHGLASSRAQSTGTVTAVSDEQALRVDLADAHVREVRGLDPDARLLEVDATGGTPLSLEPGAWASAVAVGRLALAFELVGATRAMLAMAREHALTRVQFGQPIAGFQAVRHRLVDALLAVEAAEGAARAAAQPLVGDRPSAVSPIHATMAKALAGQGARTTARHCQQVLAGIGFTAEHGFHRWFRRALVLDELLGSARVLTRELGPRALAEQDVLFDLPL
jgi:hypothetical protein